jgi:hypothetical protein
MKKLFFLLVSVAVFTTSNAQLAPNSIAPDFTLRDINGNTHHLYDYLDRGYTVFLDFSAAWCGPCWAYHNTHALRDVYENHGPIGAPGVLSGTTDDAMVMYIEGESTNTTAQLYGTTSGSAHSTFSQGDWVTGTPYPMIDTGSYVNTLNAAYNIGYFPTIYKVCPNRIINEVGQATAADLYAGVGTCVGAASTSNDPLMLSYSGQTLSICGSLDVTAIMQNHGTAALTAATIQVLQGSTVLATYNWSGSLATYATANVSVGTVTLSGSAPVVVKITSTNDDLTNDQVDVTYQAVATTTTPSTNDIESSPSLGVPPTGAYVVDQQFAPLFVRTADFTSAPPISVGAFGASDKSIIFDMFDASTVGNVASVIFDKITIPTLAAGDKVMLEFDYSYAPYPTNDPDKLEVMYSTNCGTAWSTPFSKSGATLATADTLGSFYVPQNAGQWKKESFDITTGVSSGASVLLKVKATTAYGNNAYVDNVKVFLKNTTGVKELVADASINVYPNPSTDVLNVSFTAEKSETVTIKMVDMNGRVVYQSSNNYAAGSQTASVNVQNIPAGSYSMTLVTDTKVVAKNVTVTH